MKVRTLRLLFGLVGAAGTMTLVGSSALHPALLIFDVWAGLDALLTAAFSCAALYGAFALPRLLRTRLRSVLVVIDAFRLRLVLGLIVTAFHEGSESRTASAALLGFGLVFLVAVYVRRSVVRLSNEGWPAKTERVPWWAYAMVAGFIFAPAAAIAGLRLYITNAKSAEARQSLAQFARDMARCAASRAKSPERSGLPASSEAVPRDLIRGKAYQSSPSDWVADEAFRCSGFSMDRQYFSYQWQQRSPTRGAVVAMADLDGDGEVERRFSQVVDCASPSSCSIGALVEHREPFQGGVPAYPGQHLLR